MPRPPQPATKKEQRRREAEQENENEVAEVEEAVKNAAVPGKKRKAADAEEAVPAEETKKKAKVVKEAAAGDEAAAAIAGGMSAEAEAYRQKFKITSAREGQVLPDPVAEFAAAPFSKKIRAALTAAGFAAPSPIQAQGWPVAVAGSDLVAVAKTGSGKTLGYLLPAFRALKEAEPAESSSAGVSCPPVLVLAPTRELALQILAECEKFGPAAKVTSQAVFGGVPKGPQAKALKDSPQVLVATPGRLQDLMEMGVISLAKVSYLVLDEADRMLDMGFEPEIAKILGETPSSRQTLLFTATWPKAVKKIAAKYLSEDYVHVNVGETEDLAANKAVSQEFFEIGDDDKEEKLWRILDGMTDDAKVIVFGNTKRRVDALTKAFIGRGYAAVGLHGDKPQVQREKDLKDFTKGAVWLMFATDVCARGLDIKDVTHVVNYDMARDVESYVHRIGRTGRAGAKGTSITFWNPAYDMECSPALAKIAREAGQSVPGFLERAADKQKEAKNKAWRY
mmetsp:Transcript_58781/g.140108  ORF Transcript_58781/g.140108 Transcript_58781/m.140108 type:complete len:508 (-) Transcript_58781:84-1607(-)